MNQELIKNNRCLCDFIMTLPGGKPNVLNVHWNYNMQIQCPLNQEILFKFKNKQLYSVCKCSWVIKAVIKTLIENIDNNADYVLFIVSWGSTIRLYFLWSRIPSGYKIIQMLSSCIALFVMRWLRYVLQVLFLYVAFVV